MKVSTKGRYGLRVMFELALQYGKGPILAETIAKNQQISGKYIHVLVTALRNAGLVRAARGRHGGYELSQDPSTITALDVFCALEGAWEVAPCIGGSLQCGKAASCVASEVWRAVADSANAALASFSLERMVRMHRERKFELSDFSI